MVPLPSPSAAVSSFISGSLVVLRSSVEIPAHAMEPTCDGGHDDSHDADGNCTKMTPSAPDFLESIAGLLRSMRHPMMGVFNGDTPTPTPGKGKLVGHLMGENL